MSYKYALDKYIKSPEKYPEIVLFHDANVSIIKDAFPKSKVHLLVLPRDPELSKKKPQQAFKNVKNIDMIKEYVNRAIEIAQSRFRKEWQRVGSETDEDIGVIVCCHSVPSLNNLHIHVMTDDMCGHSLKHKKHYNSFKTSFAIKFEEFPLKIDDFRMDDETKCILLLKQDLVYAGVNYKSSFKKMQGDIQHAFEEKYKRIT